MIGIYFKEWYEYAEKRSFQVSPDNPVDRQRTLGGGTAFAAEENLQEFSLDTMVVTATRTAMTVKETPSTVEIVDSKKLEQTQAKTLHDALKGALGVNVFNDFQGRSNVSIRGSESRHVLIMVDGKRLGGEAVLQLC